MSTFVLIHGSWHGAWCWYKVIPRLERAGHRVIAPDLPSLGKDALPEGVIARLGTWRLTHLGGIEAVAISPDGRVAASGVRDGKVKLLGERIFYQSGDWSVSKSDRVTEATIRLWNVKTGELLRQLPTPDAPVSHIQFSAHGTTIFAGCGKFLCCWERETGKKIWEQEAVVGGWFHEDLHLNEIIQAEDTLVSLHQGRIVCAEEKRSESCVLSGSPKSPFGKRTPRRRSAAGRNMFASDPLTRRSGDKSRASRRFRKCGFGVTVRRRSSATVVWLFDPQCNAVSLFA